MRPRPYQLVPLLMALRLETVRLLIADDVGIGKTIEGGLIARELLDRGEVKRIAVLCPPHLCDQWQQELREKFHIDAVVVRSGTASKLERAIPNGSHIFSYYRHLIVSLDYAKADRRRASFITHCPDFVIVDEAHTCTRPSSKSTFQQQRHQLIQQIAEKSDRHLLLLSATPHSGIEESFLSLLGLLQPEFEQLTLDRLTEKQRDKLASHFIQRRRADVKQWLGNETPFPERDSEEKPYKLSKEYKQLFDDVYNFARGLVKTTTQDMSYAQRRGRYWSALALIRCVMSSPAAAVATLNRQVSKSGDDSLLPDLDEDLMSSYVYDSTDQEQAVDATPTVCSSALAPSEDGEALKRNYERKLRAFVQAAQKLQGEKDQKLQSCIASIQTLLSEGFNPIIWCRYIATANYVADTLKQKLEKKGSEQRVGRVSRLEATANPQSQIRVIAITGELSEDEREIRLQELKSYPQRVLVATDCLSEGVNLQSHFSAVIHYDLPWNPNRLEQREGRIDRYGQTATQVKTLLLYGSDNPVDGAVLDVLIRKAVQIHKTLGITVPVPMDSTTVSEAVSKNERFIFTGIEHVVTFCIVIIRGSQAIFEEMKFSWFAYTFSEANDPRRQFMLAKDELRLLNPNTLNCPVFRTHTDAELTKKIYHFFPILENEITSINPWNISFMQGLFNMSTDSSLFQTQAGDGLVPLYEAKMFHQFDHRYSTYEDATQAQLNVGILPKPSEEVKQNPHFAVQPRYWVSQVEVENKLAGKWNKEWLLGFRRICRATDERTAIFSLVSQVGFGDSVFLMIPGLEQASLVSCLCACLNSLVFDFITRQKLGGTNFSFFILKQLPVLPPELYTPEDIKFISDRVLELVYTAWDMQPFAKDMGYDGEPFIWNPNRRALLRAELDAYYAKLYGLTRDELRYILDPADIYGKDFPSETFRVLKNNEIRQFGEYRTQRLVLEAWDRMFE